jgi:hypothetical protein
LEQGLFTLESNNKQKISIGVKKKEKREAQRDRKERELM